MNFKKFIENDQNLSDSDIANMYFNGNENIRSFSKKINRSIPKIYRIVHSFGKPNRRNVRHDVVKSFADSGMSISKISELTGYSKRHVINILR